MKAGETLKSLATKARAESDTEAAGKGNSVRGSIYGKEDGVKTRSCGNDGPRKERKTKSRFPFSFHRLWKSLRDFHIPTASTAILSLPTSNSKKGTRHSLTPLIHSRFLPCRRLQEPNALIAHARPYPHQTARLFALSLILYQHIAVVYGTFAWSRGQRFQVEDYGGHFSARRHRGQGQSPR